jgi:hypothetical protein
MSEAAAPDLTSGKIFNAVCTPVLNALEGDNFYYKNWINCSVSVCNNIEGRCLGIPEKWPSDEKAT